jgi:hypothetical protein
VSSDSVLIKIFIKFLREVLKIEERKLRGRLQIHEDNDEEKAKIYWSNLTGIPILQFQKSIIKSCMKQKFHYNKLEHGTFILRYGSKEKYDELIQMIDKLKKNIEIGSILSYPDMGRFL